MLILHLDYFPIILTLFALLFKKNFLFKVERARELTNYNNILDKIIQEGVHFNWFWRPIYVKVNNSFFSLNIRCLSYLFPFIFIRNLFLTFFVACMPLFWYISFQFLADLHFLYLSKKIKKTPQPTVLLIPNSTFPTFSTFYIIIHLKA